MVRPVVRLLTIVIPAQAGIQGHVSAHERTPRKARSFWIPAFAGTTRGALSSWYA